MEACGSVNKLNILAHDFSKSKLRSRAPWSSKYYRVAEDPSKMLNSSWGFFRIPTGIFSRFVRCFIGTPLWTTSRIPEFCPIFLRSFSEVPATFYLKKFSWNICQDLQEFSQIIFRYCRIISPKVCFGIPSVWMVLMIPSGTTYPRSSPL